MVVFGELDDDGGLVELMQGRGGGQGPLQGVHDDGHFHLDAREEGREGGRGGGRKEVCDQM